MFVSLCKAKVSTIILIGFHAVISYAFIVLDNTFFIIDPSPYGGIIILNYMGP